MAEAPKYRIHNATLINGVFFDNQHVPVDLDLPNVEPRNSFEPLNEAAREAFRQRDAKRLAALDAEIAELVAEIDELKKAGAGETELEGFNTILGQKRLARAQMPKALKVVPTFGGAKPTHSLAFGITHSKEPQHGGGVDQEIERARNAGASDAQLAAIRLERVVAAAIAGGASDADVKAIKDAFQSVDPKQATVAAIKAAAEIAKSAPKVEKKGADKKEQGEPRLND